MTIITIPVTSPGENDEDVYNAVMNVEEFLAEHNIRDVANFVAYNNVGKKRNNNSRVNWETNINKQLAYSSTI